MKCLLPFWFVCFVFVVVFCHLCLFLSGASSDSQNIVEIVKKLEAFRGYYSGKLKCLQLVLKNKDSRVSLFLNTTLKVLFRRVL